MVKIMLKRNNFEVSTNKLILMEILALHLYTDSIEETASFYSTVMKFPILSKNESEIVFEVGNATLTFSVNQQIHSPKYHFAFAIPFNQILEAKQWFENKVSLITYEDEIIIAFQDWKANAIYFYDNNGNILECIGRTDLNNDSEIPFSEKSIFGISEIGLVTEHPQLLAEHLHESLGCDYFKKGPNREDFVAMGDDYGLFVVSNNKRNWFPTLDKALEFPLSGCVSIGGIVTEFSFN